MNYKLMTKTVQTIALMLFFSISSFSQTTNNVEIIELNTAQFKQKVWNFDKNKEFNRISKIPLILDFHATWCRPCKMLAPHLQEIQNKYNGKLTVYKIDVDKEPELAKLFKIQAMPTIIFVNSKNSWVSELGYRDLTEFEKLVKQHFAF